MHVRVPNNVGRALKTVPTNFIVLLCGDQGAKETLGVVGSKVEPVSNFAQQHATTLNNIQQGVQTNATCGYPTMLGVVDQQCCVRTLLFKKRLLPEILQILILDRKTHFMSGTLISAS